MTIGRGKKLLLCIALTGALAFAQGQAQPPVTPKTAGSPISLKIGPPMPTGRPFTFPFGERNPYWFTLVNLSDRAVVVTGIRASGSPNNETIALTGDIYGKIEKSSTRDAYEHQPFVQQSSKILLYAGLLLPHQRMVVQARYRPLVADERFIVSYLAAAQPYTGKIDSLAPLKIYSRGLRDKKGVGGYHRFTPFTEKTWRSNSASPATGPDLFGGYPDHGRSVIIAGSPVEETETIQCHLKFSDPQPSLPLPAARKLAAKISGFAEDELQFAYSHLLGGWLVDEGETRWLLSTSKQQERGQQYPVFSPELLNDIDDIVATRQGQILIRVGDKQQDSGPVLKQTGNKLWDTYPIYYGDGMYTRGEFIHLQPAQLRAFLLKLQEKDRRLQVHPYFFQLRYYGLKLPK